MLLDAHTHLDHYPADRLPAVLAEIERQRIFTLSVSMEPASYQRNQAIAAQCSWVLPTFGIHPWEAHRYADDLEALQSLIDSSPLLGEIGLDFHWIEDKSTYPAQRRVFEHFLAVAGAQDKVVNLHTKGAEAEILALLDQYQVQRAIIHWYSGPLDIFQALIRRGCYFTMGVEVSYSDHIRRLAQELPLSQLLTETDNPSGLEWLAGEVGMPRHLNGVIDEIARLKQQTPEAIRRTVQENFSRLLTGDRWLPEQYRRLLADLTK